MKKVTLFLTLLFLLPIAALLVLSVLSPSFLTRLSEGGVSAEGALSVSVGQYLKAFSSQDFRLGMVSSLRITGASVVLCTVVSLIVIAFVNQLPAFFQKLTLCLYFAAFLLPFQTVMLPVYKMIVSIGLYDSLWSVILLGAFSPAGPVILFVWVRRIGQEQYEAAALETNSALTVFRHITLPQILPGIAVLTFLVFAQVWNMVEQPLILLQTPYLRPLSTRLNDITSVDTNYTFAGAVLYSLPVLVLYSTAALFLAKVLKKKAPGRNNLF